MRQFLDKDMLMFRPRGVVTIALVSLAIAAPATGQRNPFAGSAKEAKAGEYEFRINCALCHGLGAKSGGSGPDLTRAKKKQAHTDEEMFQIITSIRSQEAGPSGKPPGNAAQGKELFFGDANCSLCHMVNGKG